MRDKEPGGKPSQAGGNPPLTNRVVEDTNVHRWVLADQLTGAHVTFGRVILRLSRRTSRAPIEIPLSQRNFANSGPLIVDQSIVRSSSSGRSSCAANALAADSSDVDAGSSPTETHNN